MGRISKAKERVKPPKLRNRLKAVMDGDPETVASLNKVMSHPGGIMAFYAEQAVRRAIDGDTQAARDILGDFVGAILARSERTWQGPIIYVYARYLSDAFQKILDGVPSDIALGVKTQEPGRRPEKRTHERLEAIAAGWEILHRNGLTKRQATDSLEAHGVSRRSIQRAREAHPWMDQPTLYSNDLLAVAVGPIAPTIQRILGAKRKR